MATYAVWLVTAVIGFTWTGAEVPLRLPEPQDEKTQIHDRELLSRMIEVASKQELERGQTCSDCGMLLRAAYAPLGTRRYAPVLPEPLRCREFDEWTERIGIVAAVSRDELELIWEEYIESINHVLENDFADVFRKSSELASQARPRHRAAAAEFRNYASHAIRVRQRAAQVERDLFERLAELEDSAFIDEVLEWSRRRAWRRNMELPIISYPGADIHLSDLLESLEITWPDAALHRAYETEIADAAIRSAEYHLTTMAQLAELAAIVFFDPHDQPYTANSPPQDRAAQHDAHRSRITIRRERLSRERRLFSINMDYVDILFLHHLDRKQGWLLRDAFYRKRFSPENPRPDLHEDPYDVTGWFEELADEDNDLSGETRKTVEVMNDEYRWLRDHAREEAFRAQVEVYFDRTLVRQDISTHEREELSSKIHAHLNQQYHDIGLIYARRLIQLLDDQGYPQLATHMLIELSNLFGPQVDPRTHESECPDQRRM